MEEQPQNTHGTRVVRSRKRLKLAQLAHSMGSIDDSELVSLLRIQRL